VTGAVTMISVAGGAETGGPIERLAGRREVTRP
jgi:hypothetical protein